MKMTGNGLTPRSVAPRFGRADFLRALGRFRGGSSIMVMIWSAPATIPPPMSPALNRGRMLSRMITLDTASVRKTRAP